MLCVDYQRCEKSYVLWWQRLMRHFSLSFQSVARGNALFDPVIHGMLSLCFVTLWLGCACYNRALQGAMNGFSCWDAAHGGFELSAQSEGACELGVV